MNNRPRIFCIGCSFTAGVPLTNYATWTKYLATLVPEYKVYNLGIPGASAGLQAFIIKQISALPGDIIIHQITTQGRYSSYEKFDAIKESVKDENIMSLSVETKEKIKSINYATSFDWTGEHRNFAKTFYKFTSNYTILNDFENALFAIKNIPHYSFFHLESPYGTDNNKMKYDSFLDHIGKDTFEQYVGDEFMHLGEKGSEVLANWVYTNMKSRGIL